MDASWGKFIYWAATIIAVLIVAVVAIGYVSNTEEGEPIFPVIPLLVAGVIWLVGWGCRNMNARH